MVLGLVSNWKRTYWVVWIANLITSIGMMSFLPFFPSLLEELGVEGRDAVAAWAGICFAAAPLSATFSAPLWGALGDRYGRKIMVCRAMLAIAIFVGCMGWVTSAWQLLLLRVLQGAFSGFIPPSITLVSVQAPADRQGRIAGNLTTALAVGGLLGPMMGGLAATLLGSHQGVFFLVGGLALLGALLVWFAAEEAPGMRRESEESVGAKGMLVRTLADLQQVLKSPAMRSTVLLVFALQIGLGAINPLLELYVRELFHGVELEGSWLAQLASMFHAGFDGEALRGRVETLATSLLFGAIAIANLVSLSPWGRYGDRVGHQRALVQCAIVGILALLLQWAAAVYVVLLLGRLVMGVGMAGVGPLAFGLAAGEASVDRRGGAFGLVFSARTLAVAVGGTVGGLVYPFIGVRGVMLGSALIVVLALLLFRRHTVASPAVAP